MLFNSIIFLEFFTVFLILYSVTKNNSRILLCLAASYIFYGWWDYRFIVLIMVLTVFNYVCGFKIFEAKSAKLRKQYMVLSVAFSLTVLGFFKYFNFFIDSAISALNEIGFTAGYSTFDIILPVGISFYTFQTMSYTIDIYRNNIKPERSFIKFATFVAFFPQLVAGPIVRASEFLPQLQKDRVFSDENILIGLRLVIWGFFLKLVVADSLALVVDDRFDNPIRHNSLSMLIGVVFYSFQIYGDFAGYSLIAIGLARILGFRFPQNFNRPYFAKSFSEFWKRWHISLSSWLRDYLYISLGGNRNGRLLTYRNIMLTMLLGGLWHGASWNFVIWGGLHGSYLMLQHWLSRVATLIKIPQGIACSLISRKLYALILILICFILVSFSWVFFRAQSLNDSIVILAKISDLSGYDIAGVSQKFHVVKGIIIISLLIVLEKISFHVDIDAMAIRRPYVIMSLSALTLIIICALGTFDSTAFIYFQF